MVILPLTYLGNIQYFTKLCFTDCIVDVHEHFVKQSYRTRFDILAANGVVPLSLQTVNPGGGAKCRVRDMRLDYSKRWQHTHWRSIVSAYSASPYFVHYEERFAPFFHKRHEFLIDLCIPLLETVLDVAGSPAKVTLSDHYVEAGADDCDMRSALSSKARLWRPDPSFVPAEYYQVFSTKHPFAPNLSIIDMLFCEGPQTLDLLRDSRRL